MKKILCALVMMISITSYSQVEKATLVASGLTCSMCSKAIYQALQKVNTVESVNADIKESSYDIIFQKDAAISFDAIRKAVEEAGFSVAKLQVTFNFDNVTVENDKHVLLDGINFHFMHVQPQTLKGEKVLTILDKNFETSKEYKKFTHYTTMECFTTGVMESCCANDVSGKRIYHVTI
jgi:copper chaperone CopZ